jgi:recombination directionality factor gp3-like protein
MPIVNLTNVPRSFLKLGQIRKGDKIQAKRQDGTTYEKPVDLDYFRVTFLKGRNAAEIEKRFMEAYGPKPTDLNIRFADHTVDSVWDANYECYKQGGLVAKAGSTAERGLYWIFYRHPETMETLISDGRARNDEGLQLQSKAIDLANPIYRNKKGDPFFLEPVGRLKVVIPELADLAVGYFEFRPESPRDIRNVSAELGAYDAVAKQYGKTIAGIPFVIRRREEDVTARIDGKLVSKKSWVVHLDVLGEWGARALSVLERLALPEIVEGEEIPPQLESGELVFDHEPEPQESAPVTEVKIQSVEKKVKVTDDRIWTVAQKQVLIDAGLADGEFAAKGMLGLSSLPADATEAEILKWGTAYRTRRNAINPDTKKKYLAPEAAQFANGSM